MAWFVMVVAPCGNMRRVRKEYLNGIRTGLRLAALCGFPECAPPGKDRRGMAETKKKKTEKERT